MEIQCSECNETYDVDENPESCPNCGFGIERCNHPQSYRESHQIYSVDEGRDVERVYCGKCGLPLSDM